MKNNAIVRIILFSLLAFVLIAVLVIGILVGKFAIATYLWDQSTTSNIEIIDSDPSPAPTTESGTPDAGLAANAGAAGEAVVSTDQISELEIQWIAGSVTIRPGDTEDIRFSETGDPSSPMVWRISENKLIIRSCKDEFSLLNGWVKNRISKDLTITVPKDWAPREIEINTTSADISISDLTVNDIEIDSVSGVSRLTNCVAENVSLDSVSGNIQFTGSLGALDCNTVSASCTIVTDRVPRELELECVSGDMDVTLPENAGFSVKMEGLEKNLTSDFPFTKNGSIYTSGDGTCQISFDGMSGDLAIHQAG